MSEVQKDKSESPQEVRDLAQRNATTALRMYEVRGMTQQLEQAAKLGVSPNVIQDVRERQFILENSVRDKATATELSAQTKGLNDSMSVFSKVVETKEASDPKAKENRDLAERNAKGALRMYEVRGMTQQLEQAAKLGVSPNVIQDVRERQFILENSVRDKATATELSAQTKGLNDSMSIFSKAVEAKEGADPKAAEKRDLAQRNATAALRMYEVRGMTLQLEQAIKLGLISKTIKDVRERQFILENSVRNNGTATELDVQTKGLNDSIKAFLRDVKTEEELQRERKRLKAIEASL